MAVQADRWLYKARIHNQLSSPPTPDILNNHSAASSQTKRAIWVPSITSSFLQLESRERSKRHVSSYLGPLPKDTWLFLFSFGMCTCVVYACVHTCDGSRPCKHAEARERGQVPYSITLICSPEAGSLSGPGAKSVCSK